MNGLTEIIQIDGQNILTASPPFILSSQIHRLLQGENKFVSCDSLSASCGVRAVRRQHGAISLIFWYPAAFPAQVCTPHPNQGHLSGC